MIQGFFSFLSAPLKKKRHLFCLQIVIFVVVSIGVSGCAPRHHKDPVDASRAQQAYDGLNKPVQDAFEDLWDDEPASQEIHKEDLPSLPDIFQKPVTVVLTERVSLGEAFQSLSAQTKISIFIDPVVSDRSVAFAAHQQPFIQVVEGLCQTAGVRYQVQDSRIMIQPDLPYAQNYTLPFLSMSRQFTHHLNVSTDVLGASEGRAPGGDNGSHSHMNEETKNDFWQEVDANLKAILSSESSKDTHYALHRQACLISVVATQKQHLEIERYVQALKDAIGTQVLIEAKIIEVTLNNEFKSGIDWQSLSTKWPMNVPLGESVGHMRHHHSSEHPFFVGAQIQNLKALARMMERFGAVRTLSSPRLTVMNNQTAMMKVAHNEVFFQVQYTQQLGGPVTQSRDYISASSKIQSVPIGFVMTVHPSVNMQTREIVMTLRPSISRVAGVRRDPAVAIVGQQLKATSGHQIHSEIPVVEVREMDSVLTAQSGSVVMLGGLMQEKVEHEKVGLPGLSKVPFLGGLFRGQNDQRLMTELVIFLKAHIIKTPRPHAADRRLYQNLISDPRPIT